MEESGVSYTHKEENNQDPETSDDLNPFLVKLHLATVGQGFQALPGARPSL